MLKLTLFGTAGPANAQTPEHRSSGVESAKVREGRPEDEVPSLEQQASRQEVYEEAMGLCFGPRASV